MSVITSVEIERMKMLTRRAMLTGGARALGTAALATLGIPRLHSTNAATPESIANKSAAILTERGGLPALPHFAPRAKRIIYLFLAGGPSNIDMFDYKPSLPKIHGKELPPSVRNGQRVTGFTSKQESFPCVAPMFKFDRYGKSGMWVSELLPHFTKIVDDVVMLKGLHTEAINHDPAITFINTGAQQPGKPSMGAWLSYGLGSPNRDLPSYVVMSSRGPGQAQQLYSRLWGSGFLPSKHQGVQFRGGKDPVPFLSNPAGLDATTRRRMLDGLAELNEEQYNELGDPETRTRIAQYEMAFRMQTSAPDLMDISKESKSVLRMYGIGAKNPATFAGQCLLARRLAERDVPFIQVFHSGWDQHANLPIDIPKQCQEIDQASAALVTDLKQRGMLEDTLVICGGEFGRTIYSQGELTATNHGRDHHGRCFASWLAGGGLKSGFEYGETDDFCYNILSGDIHIRDLAATILHLVGIDHERFTYRYNGLEQRLTGVEQSRVVHEIFA